MNISLLLSCMGAGGSILGQQDYYMEWGGRTQFPGSFRVLTLRFIPETMFCLFGLLPWLGFVLSYQLTAVLNSRTYIWGLMSVFFHFHQGRVSLSILVLQSWIIFCFMIWINLRIQAQITIENLDINWNDIGFIKLRFRKSISFSTTLDSE